jgi:peptidoglycan hydrolase-like protein with peptidoglycan-binding domain
VQAALSVLGFDPRGIDGVFGDGTRGALRAWQRSEGLGETGFLTADQLSRLSAQAGRRTAEIEATQARRDAEARRLDTAYWAQVGEGGGEAGLRAYLDRHPEGLFAAEARERLAVLERQARGSAALADARAWEEARASDRPGPYRRYVEAHPEGAHVDEALARIEEIRTARREGRAAEAEEALGLTTVTRSLAEGRLEAFGFEPGAVDGRFDEETRRAIRRYQRSRGLEPTGYLDRSVVTQLLADSILR